MRALHCFTLFASVSLFTIGCGGGGGGYNGPWGQGDGVVRLDGKPLTEEATVTFLSAEGYSATGRVDGEGKFRLKYNGSNDLPVGTYNVAVMPAAPVEVENADPASFFNDDGSTKIIERKVSGIPEKYHQPGSSGISISVKEGANDLKIDLDK